MIVTENQRSFAKAHFNNPKTASTSNPVSLPLTSVFKEGNAISLNNTQFTVSESGYYSVGYSINVQPNNEYGGNSHGWINVHKANSCSNERLAPWFSTGWCLSGSDMVHLNAGDAVSLYLVSGCLIVNHGNPNTLWIRKESN